MGYSRVRTSTPTLIPSYTDQTTLSNFKATIDRSPAFLRALEIGLPTRFPGCTNSSILTETRGPSPCLVVSTAKVSRTTHGPPCTPVHRNSLLPVVTSSSLHRPVRLKPRHENFVASKTWDSARLPRQRNACSLVPLSVYGAPTPRSAQALNWMVIVSKKSRCVRRTTVG